MEKFYFVMPAYNESKNIEKTILQWYPIVEKINSFEGCSAILAIANDGSKDDTFAEMVRIKESNKLECFEPINKENGGHGQTVLFLYRHAISNGADYVFQTDSDGQTNPDEFWQMFENRHKYDFQIGNRNNRQDGKSRIFVTNVLKIVVWLMFHEWVTDANTPFRLMQKDKLVAIMETIPKDYFLCNVAIASIAQKWNYKVKYYNITFKPRQGGVNSINMKRIVKIGWKALQDFKTINSKLSKK